MAGAFHDQPDVVIPRKTDSLLYIIRTSSVHGIDRVPFSAARSCGDGQAGIINPVVFRNRNRVVRMSCSSEPACHNSWTLPRIECGLCGMTDRPRRQWLNKSSTQGVIESCSVLVMWPVWGIGCGFTTRMRMGIPGSRQAEELKEVNKHCEDPAEDMEIEFRTLRLWVNLMVSVSFPGILHQVFIIRIH